VIILLACSVIAVAVFRRLRIPSILAYLIVGVVVGPHGLAWIPHTQDTHFLGELGVVFLLFTVGLEFCRPQLLAMRKVVLGLGGAQVALTTLLVAAIGWLLGMAPGSALVLGGVIAMSSTAIVITQLNERGELSTRHGRLSVGILLFQDMAVIPFLILIPALAGDPGASLAGALARALLKGALVVMFMIAAGNWLLRPVFRSVASSGSAELFTLTALLFALAAAWVTQFAGLSLTLGAFLAGMMLGETEFRHQVEAEIRPFRDVLLGLSFMVVGMMLDIHALPAVMHWVLLLVAAILVFKPLSIMGLSLLAGASRDVATRTGIIPGTGGEFGFALLALAVGSGLMDTTSAQVVLAALIVTMAFAPLSLRYSGVIAHRVGAGRNASDRKELRHGAQGRRITASRPAEAARRIEATIVPERPQTGRASADPGSARRRP